MPIQVFADDAERVARAIGFRWIARKLFVGHIGVVHEGSRGLHDIDPLPTLALCQFRSPGGREHGLAEVDPWRFPLRVVGGISTRKLVPNLKLRPGAMVKRSPVDFEM